MNDFLNLKTKDIKINEYSPLVLAYIGDAVFELMSRTYIAGNTNAPVNKLNSKTRKIVKAPSQAIMYKIIEPILTEDELSILKRGRNAKSFTSAKNASITDYRHATGVEALFGYLYLCDNVLRLNELFEKYIESGDMI